MLVPWTALWEHNFFAVHSPAVASLMGNPFIRGAVTGVGVITAAAGIRELIGMLVERETARTGRRSDQP